MQLNRAYFFTSVSFVLALAACAGSSTDDTASTPAGKPSSSSSSGSVAPDGDHPADTGDGAGALVASFGKNGIHETFGDAIQHVAEREDGMFVTCDSKIAWRVPADGTAMLDKQTYDDWVRAAPFAACLAIRGSEGGARVVAMAVEGFGNMLTDFVDDPFTPGVFADEGSTTGPMEGNGGAVAFGKDGSVFVGTTFESALGAPTACKYTGPGVGGKFGAGDTCAAVSQTNSATNQVNAIALRSDSAVLVATTSDGLGFIEVPFSPAVTKAAVGQDMLAKLGIGALGAAAVDAQNRILVIGRKGLAKKADIVVLRLNEDLGLDDAFGQGGVASLGHSDVADIGELLIGPDGKIVVTGTMIGADAASHALVARFADDGTLDPSFGEGGVSQPLGATKSTGVSMTFASDGSLMLGGGRPGAGAFLAKLTY